MSSPVVSQPTIYHMSHPIFSALHETPSQGQVVGLRELFSLSKSPVPYDINTESPGDQLENQATPLGEFYSGLFGQDVHTSAPTREVVLGEPEIGMDRGTRKYIGKKAEQLEEIIFHNSAYILERFGPFAVSTMLSLSGDERNNPRALTRTPYGNEAHRAAVEITNRMGYGIPQNAAKACIMPVCVLADGLVYIGFNLYPQGTDVIQQRIERNIRMREGAEVLGYFADGFRKLADVGLRRLGDATMDVVRRGAEVSNTALEYALDTVKAAAPVAGAVVGGAALGAGLIAASPVLLPLMVTAAPMVLTTFVAAEPAYFAPTDLRPQRQVAAQIYANSTGPVMTALSDPTSSTLRKKKLLRKLDRGWKQIREIQEKGCSNRHVGDLRREMNQRDHRMLRLVDQGIFGPEDMGPLPMMQLYHAFNELKMLVETA